MDNQIVIEEKPKKRAFINYIHNFRGLAIIFVVAGHLLLNWPDNSAVHLFLKVFWENGTVLFVFIAGYLFQYLSRGFEYKNYLSKKLKNVILPYIIVSIPIIIVRLYQVDLPGNILRIDPEFGLWPTYKKIAYFFLTGAHMQQLWFVPMIAIFYLLAPLLLYIDKHPKLYYCLLLFIPISLFTNRENFNDIPLMFIHFFSVYVFGMMMSKYKEQFLEFAKKYWIALTGVTILMFLINWYSYPNYNNQLNYTHKMLFCCFSIYWLWRLEPYVPKFFATLAELSFGIFFIHYYIILAIKFLYEKTFKTAIPGNLVMWTLDFIAVVVISIIAIQVIKRITGKKSRYLIGC